MRYLVHLYALAPPDGTGIAFVGDFDTEEAAAAAVRARQPHAFGVAPTRDREGCHLFLFRDYRGLDTADLAPDLDMARVEIDRHLGPPCGRVSTIVEDAAEALSPLQLQPFDFHVWAPPHWHDAIEKVLVANVPIDAS